MERWREDKKKWMKYREKRRTADFIHELIHDPVHIGGEYVGKMAFRAVERLVPGDHILNIALCKGTGRDVGGWYLVLKFRVRLAPRFVTINNNMFHSYYFELWHLLVQLSKY